MKAKVRKLLLLLLNNQLIQSILYSPLIDYHQWSLLKFVKTNAKKVPSNFNVIDIGAGELRYKNYFKHCHYVSQDLCVGDGDWNFENIDIKSSIYDIPVKENSIDVILCTQVLEHIEFPEKAFEEFSRILKQNGKIILTVPLGQGEHQIPHDYYRYTQYALRGLGERHGLLLKEITPQGGIFINLEHVFWQALIIFVPFKRYALVRYFTFLLFLPLKILSGLLFCTLDIFDRNKNYTNNYNCLYEKK